MKFALLMARSVLLVTSGCLMVMVWPAEGLAKAEPMGDVETNLALDMRDLFRAKYFPESGVYEGTQPGDGRGCTVRVQYSHRDNGFSIRVTPDDHNFGQESESQECPYAKACFAFPEGYAELISFQARSGGVEASARTHRESVYKAKGNEMSISVSEGSSIHGQSLIVSVTEYLTTLNGVRSVKAACQLKPSDD